MLQPILRPPRIEEDIAIGIDLSRRQGRRIRATAVARILGQARIPCVIIGTHAANGYSGRPRATADVDLITPSHHKAARLIHAAYPKLAIEETPLLVRLKDAKLEAVDVLKPTAFPLWRRLIRTPRHVRVGRLSMQIASLEGVLASKYLGMTSPSRSEGQKWQDAADFCRVAVANPSIDLNRLDELARLINPRARKRIVHCIEDARAGRRLDF